MKQLNLINKNNLTNNYNNSSNKIIPVSETESQQINSVYNHIKSISNLRIFNWAHQTNLYNFKPAFYNINSNTRINNVSLITATQFITNLFKRIGILITKIKYIKIASTIELQFGYWTPRKFKYLQQVISSKTNKLITIKKWRRVYDPMTGKNKDLKNQNRIISYNKFKIATALIANFFKSNIKLAPFKLFKRWQDSSILLESIAYFAIKRNLRKIIWKLFLNSKSYARPIDTLKSPNSTGYLTGIFIKVAGRSYRIKLTNRRLVVKTEKGRYARKSTLLADKSRVNKINKYGTFAITLTTGSTL